MKYDLTKLHDHLKQYFGLLSMLILFVGVVGIDQYYAHFGIRYQSLEISTVHMLYRGITAAFNNFNLIYLYLASIAWLLLPLNNKVNKNSSIYVFSFWPFSILLITLSINLAGKSAGDLAIADMDINTTTLPQVVSIRFDSTYSSKHENSNLHYLTSTKTHMVFIKTVPNSKIEVPHTIFIKTGLINEYKTSN